MKVVVGLGNPGDRYRRTRHNVGFDVLDLLSVRHGQPAARRRFDAEIAEILIGAEKVLLVWPQTFMNVSGASVQPLVAFHQLALSDLLVVCDDMNLDTGRLRLRASGSAGGQKGLNDIIRRLGSQDIPRLRLGIGRPPPRMDAADYVLGKFRPDEASTIEEGVYNSADAVELWVREGLTAAMNRFNPSGTERSGGGDSPRRPPKGKTEEPS